MSTNLATLPNSGYAASGLRHFAQMPLHGTSDTLGTLYAITQTNRRLGR